MGEEWFNGQFMLAFNYSNKTLQYISRSVYINDMPTTPLRTDHYALVTYTKRKKVISVKMLYHLTQRECFTSTLKL